MLNRSRLAGKSRLNRIFGLNGICCAALAILCCAAAQATAETPAGEAGGGRNLAAQPKAATQAEVESASYLVREVIFNELHDHDSHGYWRYWIERSLGSGSGSATELDEAVETPQGAIKRREMANGLPLSPEAGEDEERRIRHLLASPAEQAERRKEYADDERRIGRILTLLPDAFVYEPAAEEPRTAQMPECPCVHLRFHPNPAYPARSIEARIFHAMAGELWVSAQNKRMVRLDGRLQENVDFGYGILGRLYKDGWFRLERTHVTAAVGSGDWKTKRLEVHMTGRAMLFKTIARETSEVRGGFTPVPPGLSLEQAAALVREPSAGRVPAGARPAALAVALEETGNKP